MLYSVYEFQKQALSQFSTLATAGTNFLLHPLNPFAYTEAGTAAAHALDVFAHASAHYGKPEFGFTHTVIDGRQVPIEEEVVLRKPFGQLKRFVRLGRKDGLDPKLLIVAPMSGHYATLLRGTVEQMLPDHDVYITDWRDAKMVPVAQGFFDLDDYIDYIIEFFETIGPGAHAIAVCQPSVPAYAAVSFMSADDHPCAPRTLTMMGGPIDTREAPTTVNTLAERRPLAWFEHNAIATVPVIYPGAFRRVYPGFMQLAGFMSMNLGNHMMSHWNMFKHLVQGDGESAEASKEFYEEYRAVCDMTAEFYLQTVETVFQRHALPKGEMMHRHRPVDPAKIRKTALLAVEGERDDISGLGQTKAALTLARKLPADMKKYYMAEQVGHYGIFNGRRWREMISPVVKQWIASHHG